MASETIILDDDYAMAATWAVEHVAALGVLDRAVLTDLFSICDKTRNLPARVEQRLVWVLLNDVVEGDGVSPHVCKMMDKLSPLTAETSAEVAEICVRIRQAVCIRSFDSPDGYLEFAAMLEELFPPKTANALLNASRSDMLKVLDALESGDDRARVEEAREKYCRRRQRMRKDMRRLARAAGRRWAAPRSTGSSTTSPPAVQSPDPTARTPSRGSPAQQQPRTGSSSPTAARPDGRACSAPRRRARGSITGEAPPRSRRCPRISPLKIPPTGRTTRKTRTSLTNPARVDARRSRENAARWRRRRRRRRRAGKVKPGKKRREEKRRMRGEEEDRRAGVDVPRARRCFEHQRAHHQTPRRRRRRD